MILGRPFIFKHIDMDVFEKYLDKMVEGSLWKSTVLKESMSSTSVDVIWVCGLGRGGQKKGECCPDVFRENLGT